MMREETADSLREVRLLDVEPSSASSSVVPSAASVPRGVNSQARCPTLANEFNYVPPETRPLPPAARWISDNIFRIFLIFAFGGGTTLLFCTYWVYDKHDDRILFLPCQREWKLLFKYCSIPLVSILFTWWHVWLGIQMCFYPVEFKGCWKPVFGWQGIVPRRASIMASRSCDIMVGQLITVEEIVDRVKEEDFFRRLDSVLTSTCSAVIARLAALHAPQVWDALPDWCKHELHGKVMEESRKMFAPVIGELKQNINKILDIKEMAIEVLVQNKPLLVEMFLNIGKNEFVFIQHVSAVMGFLLGVFQMLLWIALNAGGAADCEGANAKYFRCWGSFILLPVSGLIIGYFTNWLGITMIFRPVRPRIVCGGYVNLQGVFLKRQQQVSQELSAVVCKHLITAKKMLEYVVQRDDMVDAVLQIYERHTREAVDRAIGTMLPHFCGEGAVEGIKQDVIRETLKELPKHSSELEAFMDDAFGIRETMAYRLSKLPPELFEGMLHPVFQEDEWMLLLLGGVLGVLVGTLQAFALGS